MLVGVLITMNSSTPSAMPLEIIPPPGRSAFVPIGSCPHFNFFPPLESHCYLHQPTTAIRKTFLSWKKAPFLVVRFFKADMKRDLNLSIWKSHEIVRRKRLIWSATMASSFILGAACVCGGPLVSWLFCHFRSTWMLSFCHSYQVLTSQYYL